MALRLIDLPCPFCSEEEHLCRLCEAQVSMSHDEALRAEELRIACALAEYGEVPEFRHAEEPTLPIQWQPSGFALVER